MSSRRRIGSVIAGFSLGCLVPLDSKTFETVHNVGARAQVDILYDRVRLDLARASLREDAAVMKDGDALGQGEDDIHVVLYDEEREIAWEGGDQIDKPARFSRAHARARLVKQQD